MSALIEPLLELSGRLFSTPFLGKTATTLLTQVFDLLARQKNSVRGYPFQILVYHRVLPAKDPFAIAPVTCEYFDRQMQILKNHFNPVSLESLLIQIENKSVKPRTVCVTFDDGYADNYLHAYSILKKHQVPATIFLATDFMGTGLMPWHDQILLAFKKPKVNSITYSPAQVFQKNIESITSRIEAAHHILGWLKQFSPLDRNQFITEIVALLESDQSVSGTNFQKSPSTEPNSVDSPIRENLMMNWEQIQEMSDSNIITFGAHTLSHPILSTLSHSVQQDEILDSKMLIEQKLNRKIDLFAYPNGRKGDYNAETQTILKQAQFSCAVTTNPGVSYPYDLDSLEIFRRQPWDKTPNSFFSRFFLEFLFSSIR